MSTEICGLVPYPGGKRRSVADLLNRIGPLPCSMTFVEPFVGGGVVSLNMLARGLASRVRLNDRDPAVAALWTAAIQQPGQLIDRVWNFPGDDRAAVEEVFKARRSGSLRGLDLAFAELIARRRSYRNKAREPWHNRPWRADIAVDRIRTAHKLLRGRVVGDTCTALDALDVIQEQQRGGVRFLFLDPPYVEQGPGVYSHGMTEDGHRRLGDILRATDCPWLLCYDDSGLIREVYAGFDIQCVSVPLYSGPAQRRAELRIQAEPLAAVIGIAA